MRTAPRRSLAATMTGCGQAMPKQLISGSARRVVAVSVAAIAVIAIAVGVTIWRYEVALTRSEEALDSAGDARSSVLLVSAFWHDREAMNEYLIAPSPAVADEVAAQQGPFKRIAATITPEDPAEALALSRATAAYANLYSIFNRVRGAGGTSQARETTAIGQLVTAESGILDPLSVVAQAESQASMAAKRRPSRHRTRRSGLGSRQQSWPCWPASHSLSSRCACWAALPSGKTS